MNIIQKQANEFIKINMMSLNNHKKFIDNLRTELWEYKKDVHKIEFIEQIKQKAKIDYDKHIIVCNEVNCSKNSFYENTLFFLQEELDELENHLTPENFTRNERREINVTLELILSDLNKLKLGQELTYNDMSAEFEELKDFYFLNKKNWLQLFQGKVTEMIAGGIISETLSKRIIETLSENYDKLIAS